MNGTLAPVSVVTKTVAWGLAGVSRTNPGSTTSLGFGRVIAAKGTVKGVPPGTLIVAAPPQVAPVGVDPDGGGKARKTA